MLIAALILTSCGSSKSSKRDTIDPKYTQQGPGVFDDRPLDIPETGDESTQWSIILATLPNPQIAPQVLSNVQTLYGLTDAYINDRQGTAVIAYGRYTGPKDPQAILDLDRLREIRSNDSRPFAGAYLAPPSGDALGGSNAEYDLRTVKKRFGPSALYTLQLGVYGTDDNSTPNATEIQEFRKAAEQAVLELRAQGERAFYYHAPFNSMVTVGVFGSADFDASTLPPTESQRLQEVRQRYPHNYLNGQGIRETVTSASGQRVTRLQPSSLVAIPDK